MGLSNVVGSAAFRLVLGKGAFTQGLGQAQGEARSATQNIARSLSSLGASATQAGLAMTAGLTFPLTGLTKTVFDIGSSFESAFAGVEKTVDGTEAQIAELRQGIRDMANEMPATREEIAGVAEAAGQLGISVEGIEEFTRVMVMLGETTNLTAEMAATQMARIANIMQTAEQDFSRLGATVVDLGNNFATTEAEIVNMAARIAGAGQVVGLTEAQVLSLATALSSVGIRVEAGGSAISRILITMANAIEQGSEDLALFAQTAGVTAEEFATAFGQDATSALLLFLDGLNETQQAGGNVFTLLDDLELGEIRVRDATLRLAGAGDLLNDALATGEQAWQENIALIEEYEKRAQTVESQLQVLKNRFTDFFVTIFDSFRPEIIGIFERVGELLDGLAVHIQRFSELDAPVKRLILTIGGIAIAIGPVVTLLGGFALALSALLNPVGLVVIALGGLATAIIAVKTNQELLGDIFAPFMPMIDGLKDAFVGLGETLFTFVSDMEGVRSTLELSALSFIAFVRILAASVELTVKLLDAFISAIDGLVNVKLPDPRKGRLFPEITVDIDEERLQHSLDTVKSIPDVYQQVWDDINVIVEQGLPNPLDIFDGEDPLQGPFWKDLRSESGLTFDRFKNLFQQFETDGRDSFGAVRAAGEEFVKTFAAMPGPILDALEETTTGAEVFEVLWHGVVTGMISDQGLLAQAFYDTAEGHRFLEENITNFPPVADAVVEKVLSIEEAMLGWSEVQGIVRGQLEASGSALALWEQDLSNAERAAEILRETIERTGDPTGELTDQLMFLEGHAIPRLTGGVEDMELAWAENVVTMERLRQLQDEVDARFKETGNLEEYQRAQEEITQAFKDAEDPTLNLIGHQRELAQMFSDVVDEMEELFVKLGLIPPETHADINSNAADVYGNVAGMGDELIEVGKADTDVYINTNLPEVRGGVAGLGDEFDSLPPDVFIDVEADTDEPMRKVSSLQKEAEFLDQFGVVIDIDAPIFDPLSNLNEVIDRSDELGKKRPVITASLKDNASAGIDSITAKAYDRSFTITAELNMEPFLGGLHKMEGFIPHSPAEEGPLAFEPGWDWMFEGLLESANKYTDETIESLRNFVSTADSIVGLMQKSIDFSSAFAEFTAQGLTLPKLEIIQHLAAFSASVTAELGFVAQQFEEGFLANTRDFVQTATAGVDLIGNAIDTLSSLEEREPDLRLSHEVVVQIAEITRHLVQSLGDAAVQLGESRGPTFIGFAKVYAESAMAGIELLARGIEVLSGLRTNAINLQAAKEAATEIKHITEHLIKSLGDSAAKLALQEGDGFVGAASIYAESAIKGMDLMVRGLEAISILKDLGGRFSLVDAKEAATEIKFLVEHLIKSLGDSAAKLALFEGEAFVGEASAYAESAMAAVELFARGLEAIQLLIDLGGSFSLTDAKEAVTEIKFIVEHLIKSIGDAALALATTEPADFLDGAAEYSETVIPAVELFASVVDFLSGLTDLDHAVFATDFALLFQQLAYIAQMAAEELERTTVTWGEEVNPRLETFASDVGSSVSVLSDALGLLDTLSSTDLENAFARDFALLFQQLADVARMAAEELTRTSDDWSETVNPRLDAFSGDIGNSISILSDIVSLLESLGKGLTVPEEIDFRGLGAQLAEIGRVLAEEAIIASATWGKESNPQLEALATDVGQSIGIVTDVLGLIMDLSDLEDGIPAVGNLRGIGRSLAQKGLELAQGVQQAISTWTADDGVTQKIENFNSVIGNAVSALSDVLGLLRDLSQESEQENRPGDHYAGLAPFAAVEDTADALADVDVGRALEGARRLADLGIQIGTIVAEAAGRILPESERALTSFTTWNQNVHTIFDLIKDIVQSMPAAVSDAASFETMAQQIAASLQSGSLALAGVGLGDGLFVGSTLNAQTGTPSLAPTITLSESGTALTGAQLSQILAESAGARTVVVQTVVDGKIIEEKVIDVVQDMTESTYG